MKRIVLSVSMFATACGDDGGEDPTTSGDSTSTTDATVGTDGSSTTTPDGDSTSGTTLADDTGSSSGSSDGGTASSSGSSSDGETTDTGTSGGNNPVELVVTLEDAEAFMNCKPIVEPDPLTVAVNLFFDNPGEGTGTADVTAARLSTGGIEAVSFDVTPTSFGPFDPDDMTNGSVTKVPGSADPQDGCETLTCGAEYDLEIVFDVDGTEVTGATTVFVFCGL